MARPKDTRSSAERGNARDGDVYGWMDEELPPLAMEKGDAPKRLASTSDSVDPKVEDTKRKGADASSSPSGRGDSAPKQPPVESDTRKSIGPPTRAGVENVAEVLPGAGIDAPIASASEGVPVYSDGPISTVANTTASAPANSSWRDVVKGVIDTTSDDDALKLLEASGIDPNSIGTMQKIRMRTMGPEKWLAEYMDQQRRNTKRFDDKRALGAQRARM